MIGKYRRLELKGKRASKKALKEANMTSKSDFPYSKLKCMRGEVTGPELVDVLEKVNIKEKSLFEMESDLVHIKEMRYVGNYSYVGNFCILK